MAIEVHAYDGPASNTSTDTCGFSERRFATTLPAVPPEGEGQFGGVIPAAPDVPPTITKS
jgi:hypothetical protein